MDQLKAQRAAAREQVRRLSEKVHILDRKCREMEKQLCVARQEWHAALKDLKEQQELLESLKAQLERLP